MSFITFNRDSVNWKLIAPSFFIFIVIIICVYFIANYYIEKAIYESANRRANEISEVINISVESDSTIANMTRANNSVATFDDVKGLYIIDPENEVVMVSSNYFYTRRSIDAIQDDEAREIFSNALTQSKNSFYKKPDGNYIYHYYFNVKAEQGLSFKKLLLIVDLNNANLNKLFRGNLNSLMIVFMFAVILSMVAIYFGAERIIISPLKSLLKVIDQGSEKDKPATFEYISKDEVGRLVDTYNEMILKEYEQKRELIEAKERSEAAAKAKGNFLSVMSHEIRTPMNGVIGGCSFLESTQLADDQKRHVRIIRESSQQLLALVNDILDFSKIESGKIIIENSPVDLIKIIKQIMILFEKNVEDKGIAMELVEPESILPTLLGDEVRIKQVLINLISNAVKFTTEGRISIRLDKINRVENKLAFIIEVHDSGIGIENEKAEELFSSFTQADTSTTRKFGGTGLGLAISKQLTELMGGHIWFDSQPGKGTTFYVQLQLEVTDQLQAVKADAESSEIDLSMQPARIMLVEDTEVNRIIALEILNGLGHEVVVAENGQQAVDTFVQHDDLDLILMDCFMPVMDGFEASTQIRSIEKEQGRQAIPIIALTADVTKENENKCKQAGMDDFFIKPYVPQSLVRKLATFLS